MNIRSFPRVLFVFNVVTFSIVFSLLAGLVFAKSQSQQKAGTRLHGKIVDGKTGEPIAKVKIIVIETQTTATSDSNGNFKFDDLPGGDVELYVSTVGYGLVKKKVSLKEGEDQNLDVALNQEAAPQSGEVTVTSKPFEETETNTASESTLNKSELRTLSSVLAGDPVRAAQALPGVISNDDFTSGFALRGAGFDRIGFYLDGVLMDNPVHTFKGTEDTGSLSILNADAIDSVSLFSGAFPAKYGDATAGVLGIQTREGNKVGLSGRVNVSLLSASGVLDGPIDSGRGDWLISLRKSYLNYALGDFIQRRVGNNQAFILDFADAMGKVEYNVSSRSRVGMTALVGKSNFDQSVLKLQLNPNDILKGDSRNWVLDGNWTYTESQRLVVQTRIFGVRSAFTDTNPSAVVNQDGHTTQVGGRSDVNFLATPDNRIEAGVYIRAINSAGFQLFPPCFGVGAAFCPAVESFSNRANEQGYYGQDTWTNSNLRLSFTGGARIDHSDVARQTTVTPRTSLTFSPTDNLKLRFGWGQFTQFPDLNSFFGLQGNPNLRAERATHYNVGVERLIGDRTRVTAEFYDRQDSDLLIGVATFLPFILGPVQLHNTLNGYARGFEVSVQRRSANRLTGWVSYSYSKTHLHDQLTNLDFISDFDQRHTVSAYGSYRLTETLNLSSEWRFGSGLPFFTNFDGQILERPLPNPANPTRLPAYSRVDLRLNKAFYFKRSKLTLSGEVLNVLDRANFRQVFFRQERLLPILPSVGVAFEF